MKKLFIFVLVVFLVNQFFFLGSFKTDSIGVSRTNVDCFTTQYADKFVDVSDISPSILRSYRIVTDFNEHVRCGDYEESNCVEIKIRDIEESFDLFRFFPLIKPIKALVKINFSWENNIKIISDKSFENFNGNFEDIKPDYIITLNGNCLYEREINAEINGICSGRRAKEMIWESIYEDIGGIYMDESLKALKIEKEKIKKGRVSYRNDEIYVENKLAYRFFDDDSNSIVSNLKGDTLLTFKDTTVYLSKLPNETQLRPDYVGYIFKSPNIKRKIFIRRQGGHKYLRKNVVNLFDRNHIVKLDDIDTVLFNQLGIFLGKVEYPSDIDKEQRLRNFMLTREKYDVDLIERNPGFFKIKDKNIFENGVKIGFYVEKPSFDGVKYVDIYLVNKQLVAEIEYAPYSTVINTIVDQKTTYFQEGRKRFKSHLELNIIPKLVRSGYL